ncbi:MAG: TIGR03086 family metal-binding protein [Microlunatus sp.]
MSPAERHRQVAAGFSARVDGVRDWDAPTPVSEWTARDVVGHLLGWLPGFLGGGGVTLQVDGPGIDTDPVAAWHTHATAVQALLDGPAGEQEFSHPQVGSHPLGAAIDQFYTTDVFLHTWDLARATGQDDTLDSETCGTLLAGMEPWDEILRSSGQYGPRVPVPDDAPAQDRLMGFIGRDPAWRP